MHAAATTVIVGASVAGIRAAAALRHNDPHHRIILVDGENEEPYDKPPLSKAVLSNTDLPSPHLTDHFGHGIDYRKGTPAVAVDTAASTLSLGDGSVIRYDNAILATGSAPRHLPALEGIPCVHYLRTFADATALRNDLRRRPRVIVVGGGFIGSEVASSARELGLDVTIIEAGARMAARVLPEPVSHALAALHALHGVTVRCRTVVHGASYDADRRAVELNLDDGDTVVGDVVVVGIGTTPCTDWAADSSLPIRDGFVCGPDLRVKGTSNLYAIGDVARWFNPRYGDEMRVEHWTNAREHAAVAAHNIVHPHAPRHASTVPFVWSDQHGTRIQHIGDPDLTAVDIDAVELSHSTRVFTYSRGGITVGATGFNAQGALAKIRKQLVDQRAPSLHRDHTHH
ncbi:MULTISPECIES: FAD/NAD(P)-binding oxidoreductase [Rhodococcus]|uniref:FAD/NAD(P)-binding oxidoreductase n=1 Tax=Rhodococcus oxybenzonivorans TaxID=1990687 RepID=A0AAE5A755_9NOCA|nr:MULTISPECIES: FAD/NAD(P)-binding oxidoreductase [Rhodococcus]MDV7243487.1 FAD/NAD(P)-binding oxidoreductase [Rhodococcus oxybenzonivorans]MDV7265194.1 FAD/NAD(P)-binding oxidoreductase [Rhodococcus oxybenzonivorans]MDV7277463.1 FAD/NAD(P)-binding oxidoreductase [Rhodococcus oxybenzonivorans]MDV7335509.1 FAD/NAD(P)-binding oxidoreductase [Rhodococcus oxybenzonivorans]MDV7347175.1 FAD/NAD(P)-binding oxidoreductase [Rhodococcus oxybenzonivorans]